MSQKDKIGWLLIFCVLLAFGGIGYGVYTVRTKAKPDAVTLCRTDTPIELATIVIIDKTDPFSPAQQRVIQDRLLKIKEGLDQFSRLAIHVLWNEKEREAGNRQLMFSFCNPGQGKDANQWYQNPAMIQANYNKTFKRQFDSILAGLLQPGTAALSPIADTVFSAIKAEQDVKTAKTKHIILISDLLEYTKDTNFYDPKLISWEKLKARVPADTPEWIRDTTVEVLVVTRDKKFALQNTLLKDAWTKFFQNLGITPTFEFF